MEIEINIPRLNRLIHSFYTLTKYRIAFYDTSFRKIICYPPDDCSYCQAIRSLPGKETICQESDEAAFNHCQTSNDLYCYKCHAGLTEAAISLKYRNITVGHIMFGQISTEKSSKKRFEELVGMLQGTAMSEEEKKKIISKITYQDQAQIQAASMVLIAIGKYALSEELFSLKKSEFVERIDNFIMAHITDKITSDMIAKELSVSRTILYSLSNEYLKMGIGRYIQNKRLEKAEELLASTDKKIEEISFEAGFSDYNYFQRTYHKKRGCSPSAYRRKYKENNT